VVGVVRTASGRRELGAGSLVMILISASGPMTVLVGGLVTTFAVTGDVGTPLSYPILAGVLALFSVGYAAMSRQVRSAGGFYPYVALGLGRGWGVASSFIALIAYSTVQIGLFGLFGVVVREFVADYTGLRLPWWAWSAVALAVVGLLGIRKIDLNAKVLACLLAAEISAVVLFDVGAFLHPAGGTVSLAGLAPGNLFKPGFGVVFAFAITGYLGFEQGAVYSEEAREPRRTVARATYLAIAITGVLYTVTAWALTVGAGPDAIVARAQDPDSRIPFAVLAVAFGRPVSTVANALLLTSVFACMLSIHNCVARYVFAMSRDHVLPFRLVRTGRRLAAPVTGSLAQSAASVAVVVAFAVLGLDPLTRLFAWLSFMSALAILALLAVTSIAVVGYFRTRPAGRWRRWRTLHAPVLAAAGLVVVGWLTAVNAGTVLGSHGPLVADVLIGIDALVAVGGFAYARVFRIKDPVAYGQIGVNAVRPRTVDAGAALGTGTSASGTTAFRAPPLPRRWHPVEQIRALVTVVRLWPLWRRVHAAVPEVALLPRYRGVAALRSMVRHAPLAAVRMPVEIMDGYAALVPWMSADARTVAGTEADRLRLRGQRRTVAIEAAVLATALRARSVEFPGLGGEPLLHNDLAAEMTVGHLARVGRALRRSAVVTRTLRRTPARVP